MLRGFLNNLGLFYLLTASDTVKAKVRKILFQIEKSAYCRGFWFGVWLVFFILSPIFFFSNCFWIHTCTELPRGIDQDMSEEVKKK